MCCVLILSYIGKEKTHTNPARAPIHAVPTENFRVPYTRHAHFYSPFSLNSRETKCAPTTGGKKIPRHESEPSHSVVWSGFYPFFHVNEWVRCRPMRIRISAKKCQLNSWVGWTMSREQFTCDYIFADSNKCFKRRENRTIYFSTFSDDFLKANRIERTYLSTPMRRLCEVCAVDVTFQKSQANCKQLTFAFSSKQQTHYIFRLTSFRLHFLNK